MAEPRLVYPPDVLAKFIQESNAIEGITKRVDMDDMELYQTFLDSPEWSISNLNRFVKAQAGAILRELPGLDVKVGNYMPPRGGPEIRPHLEHLVNQAQNKGPWDTGITKPAYWVHREYEMLHPYLDGNGRSGRLIWLWMKLWIERDKGVIYLPFLQKWYYDSLK